MKLRNTHTPGCELTLHVLLVLFLVDTHDKHWGIGRWSGDNNVLGTALQVSAGLIVFDYFQSAKIIAYLLNSGENTSGLDNNGGTS